MDLAVPTAAAPGDVAALVVLATVLVPVSIADVRERRIPDVLVLPALAVALLLRALGGASGAWPLAWAAIAGACLLLPAVIRPEGMGMGDVKLVALIGACLGALALPALCIALVAGAVGGAAWAVVTGVPLRHATIPFGPYLAAGAVAIGLPVTFLH